MVRRGVGGTHAEDVAAGSAGPLVPLVLSLLAEVLQLQAEHLPESRAGQAVDQDVGRAAEGQEDAGNGAGNLIGNKKKGFNIILGDKISTKLRYMAIRFFRKGKNRTKIPGRKMAIYLFWHVMDNSLL